MDDFEKLAKLVGAPVNAALGAGLPRSRGEAKALGVPRYFTGKPCKSGHVAERSTSNKVCAECSRQYNASPKGREAVRKYSASPKGKETRRQYFTSPKNKTRQQLCWLARTNDAVLFAINQAALAATHGKTHSDIVTQCPDPQRSQLQSLIDRIRADPKAGKAVIALLRTMRELRKTELAEASADDCNGSYA